MEFPNGLQDIMARYGDPRPLVIHDGPQTGAIHTSWPARILAPVDVPWRGLLYDTGIPDEPGHPRLRETRQLWVHREIALEVGHVLRAIMAGGLHTTIQRWGGCYNWRRQRNSTTKLSTHCWGIALDFDPHEDPLGDEKIDQDERVVKIFEERGWTWGGRWGRTDAMHYQAASGY